MIITAKARFFFISGFMGFFFQIKSRGGGGGGGGGEDQLTGHFLSEFFNISRKKRKNSNTSKVDHQSVLNL